MFRCIRDQTCISLNRVEDGTKHCSDGSDEILRDMSCPTGCVCVAQSVVCRDVSMANMSKADQQLSANTRELVIERCLDVQMYMSKQKLPFLYKLYLLNNHLEVLYSTTFASMINLQQLYIRNDIIHKIHMSPFKYLRNLRLLELSNTQTETIETDSFVGLTKLNTLIIAKNKVTLLKETAFTHTKSLTDLQSNSFKFCCMANKYVTLSSCLPKQDEFSNCTDLMSNGILRVLIWIMVFCSIIGNSFVIFWRLKQKDAFAKASSFLVFSLAFSDFFMGIYLLIVASVDLIYRGRYIEYDEIWRYSFGCTFAGMISVISTEMSVVTLLFISLERCITIMHPLKTLFTLRQAIISEIVAFVLILMLSIIPALPIAYFMKDGRNEFYSRSGVCLPLHLTREYRPGWEYSVAIFIGFNFVGFVLITVSYVNMFYNIRKIGKNVR